MECNYILRPIFKYSFLFFFLIFLSLILHKNNVKNINKLFISFFSLVLLFFIDDHCNRYSDVSEKFTNDNSKYAPIKYSMGPYDDLILKPEGCSNWRHPPACKKLYKPSTLYTPQGNPFPLKPKNTSLVNSNGPNVDGTPNTPNDMFMFAYNQCRPECCPSTYSCDHGCVCTNEQQRNFINSRGRNRNSSEINGISKIDT